MAAVWAKVIWKIDLEIGQHLLHTSYLGAGIACGVVGGVAHVDGLDDSIVNEHGEALAPRIAEHGHRSGVVENKPQGLGELAARVAEELDHGALHALSLRPCFHHCTIIHAEDEDLIHALGLQLISFLQIPRHLGRGSGGRESTRKANKHNFLTLAILGQGHLLRREVLVQAHCRNRVSHYNTCTRTLVRRHCQPTHGGARIPRL